MKNRKQKLMIGIVILGILLFTGSIGYIAIENVEPAPVITGNISVTGYEVNLERDETWSWNIGEPVDPAFDTATVKGTLTFNVLMTGDPVDTVYLEIVGVSSGASPDTTKTFTYGVNGAWILSVDTTTLNDGEYDFTLFYNIDIMTDSDPPVAFTSFGFLLDGGEVVFDVPDNIILIGVIIGVSILLVIIWRKKKGG